VTFVLTFVRFLAIAVWLLVLARVVLSWVDPTGRGRIATYVVGLTEPILGPVRRALPSAGMMDWSGFLVLFVLGLLIRYL
jgi:YggT family protein